MQCENELCIFCNNYKCKLTDIKINGFGMCADCILINIPKDELAAFKEMSLEKHYNLYQ